MASAIYNSFKRDIANGSIDLDTDTIKVMLVTSTYAPNVDTHTKRSDITNEVVGTGYVAGGGTLASKTVAVDNTNDRALFDGDNQVWATASITARGAVLYKARGGASTADELICYIDFGADITSTAADFTLSFNAVGIIALT
jgi:hypothetical protein